MVIFTVRRPPEPPQVLFMALTVSEHGTFVAHFTTVLSAFSFAETPRKPYLIFLLVVFVLLSLNVILQEHFNLPIHFWPDVFKEETGDDCNATKSKRRKSDLSVVQISEGIHNEDKIENLPNTFNIALHERCASCFNNSRG